MKVYWVVQATHPMRTLCSDGMIRKNLRNAPDGVVYKKFRQMDEPTKKQIDTCLCQCQKLPHKFKARMVLVDQDGFSDRTGKIRHGMVTQMRNPINDLMTM